MSGQPLESGNGVGRVGRVAANVAVLLDDGSSSRRQEGVGIEFEGRGDSVNDHVVDRLENLKLRGELGQPVFRVDSSGVALDLVSPHEADSVAVAELGVEWPAHAGRCEHVSGWRRCHDGGQSLLGSR